MRTRLLPAFLLATITLTSSACGPDSSELLGRYVMDHHYGSGASARMPGFTDRRTIGRRPNGIYVARFRNVKTAQPDFLRGYGMQGGSGRSGWGRGGSARPSRRT